MLKFLILAGLAFIAYHWFIKPLFSVQDPKSRRKNTKVNFDRKPPQKTPDYDDAEEIDFEEVK